jgi:hypothetical protein
LLLRAHIQTSQAEVRKITLHQIHLARQPSVTASPYTKRDFFRDPNSQEQGRARIKD